MPTVTKKLPKRFPITLKELAAYLRKHPERNGWVPCNSSQCPIARLVQAKLDVDENTMDVYPESMTFAFDGESVMFRMPKWATEFIDVLDESKDPKRAIAAARKASR